MFDSADVDNDLVLTEKEFKSYIKLQMKLDGSTEEQISVLDEPNNSVVKDAFRWTDSDRDGNVDWKELS